MLHLCSQNVHNMLRTLLLCLFLSPFLCLHAQEPRYSLVIHGGAGTILRQQLTPEMEKAYTDALREALQAGYRILQSSGSSLDAVEAAVRVMEDNPLFNAGKGAVFTAEGKNELDAAIMNGKTLEAGSVAGVTIVKNPITAARAVMEKSKHVMLIGEGANRFAKEAGLEIVDPSYFRTEERWRGLQRARELDSIAEKSDTASKAMLGAEFRDYKYGTVGAVAVDKQGNLAAATSTGGMTNKKFGRVGDAPIIGAGTYANNVTCAISCTGWGEYFIRLSVARTVSDLVEYRGATLKNAAEEVIMKKVPALGGDGGLIGIDKDGHMTMPFNTAGMYRGAITVDGKMEVKIFKD